MSNKEARSYYIQLDNEEVSTPSYYIQMNNEEVSTRSYYIQLDIEKVSITQFLKIIAQSSLPPFLFSQDTALLELRIGSDDTQANKIEFENDEVLVTQIFDDDRLI